MSLPLFRSTAFENNTHGYFYQPNQSSKNLHYRSSSRVDSTSFDSCDTTVDGSCSPRHQDSQCLSVSSLDGIFDYCESSMSSTENQEDSCAVLNCTLKQKTKIVPDDTKFKTELCKKWSETGSCPYKNRCKFAHGRQELNEKKISNKGRYKSKKCVSFYNNMFCSYGSRCLFLHEYRCPEDLVIKAYYEKYLVCPDLMTDSSTQKKTRLPVFKAATECPQSEESAQGGCSRVEGQEINYFKSFGFTF